jgi:hypothetical protein
MKNRLLILILKYFPVSPHFIQTNGFLIAFFISLIPSLTHSQIAGKNMNLYQVRDTIGQNQGPLSINARENFSNILNISFGYRNLIPAIFRTEISGFFFYKDYPTIKLYGASLSIYSRNSVYSGKYNFNALPDPVHLKYIYFNNTLEYSGKDGNIYFEPGLSLFSKNRKVSLDIYKKFSNPIIIDGIRPIQPYKVSLHF